VPSGLRLRAGATLAAGLLGGLAAPSAAGPWTLGGSVSAQLQALTNPRLQTGQAADDIDGRLTTRLGLNLARPGPVTSLALDASVAPVFGSQTDSDAIGLLSPRVAASFNTAAKRVTLNGGLSAAFTSTDFLDQLFLDADGDGIIDPGELIFSDETATQFRAAASLGLNWTPTALDSIGLSLSAQRRDYFDGATNLVPNSNLGLNGSWSRPLAPDLTGRLGTSLGWFVAESQANTETASLDITGGLSWTVNSRMTLSGNAGIFLANTEQTLTGQPGQPRVSDFQVGGTGGLALSYATADFTLSATLSQGLQPTSLGTVQNTSSLGLSLAWPVNAVSTVGISARLQYQQPLGQPVTGGTTTGDSFAVRIAPYYSYDLDAYSSLRLGYTLDVTDQTTTRNAVSHSVSLTLTRRFTLMP
jgi:hypothetical protein